MKQTLFAWLGSLLSRLFKTQVQEVGEGSIGIQAQGNVYLFKPLESKIEVVKTRAEQDFEYLKAKFASGNPVAAISRDRYDDLLRLSFENEEVDAWLDQLHTKFTQPFIFVDDCHGIGFVHS